MAGAGRSAADAARADGQVAADAGPDAAPADRGVDQGPSADMAVDMAVAVDAAAPDAAGPDAEPDAALPDAEPPPAILDHPCAPAARVGASRRAWRTATRRAGQVTDAVIPGNVARATLAEGPCELLQPPGFFCDPPCAVGTSCGEGGACVPQPQA
ncbi:MAG: hypothetical protein R3F43_25085 [bacterium]